MPATPRRSTQPALWPHGRPALHISGARPAIQISGVSASRRDAAALFREGEAPAEPPPHPHCEPAVASPASVEPAAESARITTTRLATSQRKTAIEPFNGLKEQPREPWVIGNLGLRFSACGLFSDD